MSEQENQVLESIEPKKKKRRIGITGKNMIRMTIILVVVMLIIGAIILKHVSKNFNFMTDLTIELETDMAREKIKGYFDSFVPSLKAVSNNNDIQTLISSANMAVDQSEIYNSELYHKIIADLKDVEGSMPEGTLSIYVGIDRGNYMLDSAGWIPDANYKIADSVWYKRLKEISDQEYILTGAYEDQGSAKGKHIISMIVPVYEGGTIIGGVVADIDLSFLQNSLSEIAIGTSGGIDVFDSDDKIVYHADSSMLDLPLSDTAYSEDMKQLIENRQDTECIEYKQGEDIYHGTTLFIPGIDWQILGRISDVEYNSGTSYITKKMNLVLLLTSILLLIVVSGNIYIIVKPVKKLNGVAERLAEGELDVDISVNTDDELGDLGRSISKLVDRLQNYIKYINEVSSVLAQMGKSDLVFTLQHDYAGEFRPLKIALEEIQKTLSQTMFKILDAADQVDGSAGNMSAGAQSLAQGAAEQASTIEELAASVQELSSQSTQEASRAIETTESVNSIGKEILYSNQQMKEMLSAMDNISEHSTEIEKIVKTVEDIAFQTNILALNAAVEAARAGSAGKGFAVVADEVSNLAGKSSAAAKSITKLIQDTITAVKGGVEIAGYTATALEKVSQNMKGIVSSINEITKEIQGESLSMDQISTSIDQISTVVQTNSATSEESAATAEELASQVVLMKQLVHNFKLDDKFRE